MKKALITGVTGQDGAYLAEFLLQKGYEVHGIKRRSSLFNTQRIDHLYQDPHVPDRNLHLHYGDLTDSTNLIRIIQEVQPDEIYNLAAMSHVAVSFEAPEYTADVDGIGTLRLLEALAEPDEARLLGPSILREIVFRVLQGEQGGGKAGDEHQQAQPSEPGSTQPPSVFELPSGTNASPAGSGLQVQLKAIRFSGDTELAEAENLQALIKPVLGKTLDHAGIQQLVDSLTRYLRGRGYVLARAYLPRQDLTEGELEIV